MFDLNASINQRLINWPNIVIKREDKIHPDVSGNKYRKLYHNLEFAKAQGYRTLLTFGGAYSNHIAATSAAGKLYGFNTIGVIRGDELLNTTILNPTLTYAKENGMVLHFVSRSVYQEKMAEHHLESLRARFGDFYLIPEGGTNRLAVKGCQSILTKADDEFEIVACCVGTGGTISGLITTANSHQTVLGFPALKGTFLADEINRWLIEMQAHQISHWHLVHDYHFGGYGKTNDELIKFINHFYQLEGIKLDPIYTGKMVFGIVDMLNKNKISKDTQILLIHTGGLQGISGFNQKQNALNKPSLDFSQ